MEKDILDSLEDIGYKGALLHDFQNAVQLGPASVAYTSFISDVVGELCSFYAVGESVNPISADGDEESVSHFLLELNGFLRAYGCPYPKLMEGPLDQRLHHREANLLLLNFLITEYQAAQIYFTDRPDQAKIITPVIESEMPCATQLKFLLIALGFPKPPANIAAFQLFSKLEAKIKELVTLYPDRIGSPLLKANLSTQQWNKVIQINDKLTQEYNLRRMMLLKRLDVTIQSFLWSDKAKAKQDEAMKVYQPLRQKLNSHSAVSIADLLAARDFLLIIEKTNSNRKGTETPVNKVLIGDVPDRGGRTGSMQAPPPEMPSFKKRQSEPQGQRNQYRGGSARGRRVQSGPLADGNHGGRGGRGGRGRY